MTMMPVGIAAPPAAAGAVAQDGPPAVAGDAPPQVAAIIDWDVATWSRALPMWEAALDPSLVGQVGLEIGACGGGLSLWMAAKGCHVICSFYRENMDNARALHRAYGVADRLTYQPIDATILPHRELFDVIMFKSVLGGIGAFGRLDRAQEAVRRMYLALKPGGRLLFAENAVGTVLHRVPRTLKRGRSWRYFSVEEMKTMLSDFSQVQIETTGFFAAFGLSERQRGLLGRIDSLVCHRLPAAWHYVMFGVARK